MISESLSNHIYLYSPSRKGVCSKYFQGLRPYLIVDDNWLFPDLYFEFVLRLLKLQ